MQVPTVHLNGTSRDALIEQLSDAQFGIRQAIELLGKAAPNGRDYYPQGDDAFRTAHAEHEARVARLAETARELEELAMAIYRQGA